MKAISKTFFTGLAATVPLFITIYVLYWLISTMESLVSRLISVVLPDEYYVPGIGLMTAILVVLLIGLFMRTWIFRRVFAEGEKLFARSPLVKTVYGASRDLMGFVSSSRSSEFSQVVLVRMGEGRLLGFVTREDVGELVRAGEVHAYIAVYLPMSYMVGGYTVMLPRSAVEPINISRAEAMRFAITGGLATRP